MTQCIGIDSVIHALREKLIRYVNIYKPSWESKGKVLCKRLNHRKIWQTAGEHMTVNSQWVPSGFPHEVSENQWCLRLSGRVHLTRTENHKIYYILAFSRSKWCLLVWCGWKCNILIGCHMQGNQCHFLAFYISQKHWHKSEHAEKDILMFKSNQRWQWNNH